jgi:hypothetical protein
MTRMREQDLVIPGCPTRARFRCWGPACMRVPGGSVRQAHPGGDAEVKPAARRRGAPASAGSRYALWRSVSCLAKGVLRQGCL